MFFNGSKYSVACVTKRCELMKLVLKTDVFKELLNVFESIDVSAQWDTILKYMDEKKQV